jgi:hypothetical protein
MTTSFKTLNEEEIKIDVKEIVIETTNIYLRNTKNQDYLYKIIKNNIKTVQDLRIDVYI